ncbi:MAG TPA: ribulose-phosphate 3-epimerase [Chitinophagaceae bacterium]|nr:ribulose-phosphate 3-epimerase [Chitinophagaceae bacterium]
MARKDTYIAPSLLASDFLKTGAEIDMVNKSEADWIHLDVMDGRFVPNISFGLPVIDAVRRVSNKPMDVHLMIEEPGKYAKDFKEAGANHLTVHIEACPNLHRNLQQIRDLGMKTGIAVNPHTPIADLVEIIQDADIVNLMSVNPGFGGQSFIPHTLHKIKTLRQLIDSRGLHTLIEIDGGVNSENAVEILLAGADVLVAGSEIFKAENPFEKIHHLKHILD